MITKPSWPGCRLTRPTTPRSAQGHASIAWPNDILYDSAGRLVGYVMVNVQNAVPLLQVFNPRSRARTLPNFNRRYLHRTARNLAAALGALHDSNYIVGDLNESNIMVTPSALVTLIDANSFQVQRRVGSKPVLAPLPGGQARIHAARTAGQNLRPRCRASPSTIVSAWLMLIFQLLMEGNHPSAPNGSAVATRRRWKTASATAPGRTTRKPILPLAPPRGGPGLDRLAPGAG